MSENAFPFSSFEYIFECISYIRIWVPLHSMNQYLNIFSKTAPLFRTVVNSDILRFHHK